VSWPDHVIRWTTAATVVVLAGAAAVVSFGHGYAVTRAHGGDQVSAVLSPICIDALVLAAGMVLLDAARRGEKRPKLAVFTLAVGILGTIAANVVYGLPYGPIGMAYSAVPAVALTLSVELLMGLVRRAATGAQMAGTPSGTPADDRPPVVVEEPVPAPEIRDAGTEFAAVPGPRVRADTSSPWRSFDGPSDGSAAAVPIAEIRRAETDFAAAQNGQIRTESSDLAATEHEDPAEWVRLLGLYRERVPGGIDSDESRHPVADPESQPDAAETGVPDAQVRVPEAYPDAVPADLVRSSQDPANGTAPHADLHELGGPEVRVPGMYLDPDPHQVQAVAVFSAELGDGEVPSLRRIKATLKIGQPKAESVRDYLRRLVDAQPLDDERVGADAG